MTAPWDLDRPFTGRILGSVDAALPLAQERAALAAYWDRLLERVRAVPGVESATLSTVAPPDRGNYSDNYDIDVKPLPPGPRRSSSVMPYVSHGYFETLGMPLRGGRWFTDRDTPRAARVAVISEGLARREFVGEDPIGYRIQYGGRSLEIVGVVGDVKYRGLQRDDEPTFYQLSSQQAELWDLWLLVRMNGHAQGQVAAVRQAIRALDRNVSVDRIGTMADAMSGSLSLSRFRSLLMTAFAATALLLAAIGIYGVVGYAVAKRTKEIGLRMALGATPSGVVAIVVSQASRPIVAGIASGLTGAFLLTRVLETMLFGVTPSDPLTLLGAVVMLSTVATAAWFIPALRASHIDPLVALRNE